MASAIPTTSSWGHFLGQKCSIPGSITDVLATASALALGVGIMVMSDYCALLLWRFTLQMMLLYSCVFVVLHIHLIILIQKRLKAGYPSSAARILKTMLIPSIPHPQIDQRQFCWVEVCDDDYDEGLCNTNNRQGVEETPLGETDIQDTRDWSHVPCVLVDPKDEFRQGRVLTVSMIDGDPTRVIYLPYQESLLQKYKPFVLKSMVCGVAAVLALHLLYPGEPMFFANSQRLEDRINASMAWFWSSVGLGDDSEEEQEESEQEPKDCSIPLGITVLYYVYFLFFFVLPVYFIAKAKWKKRNDSFDAPPDSYRLLSGDDDDEEGETGNGNTVVSQSQSAVMA